MTQHKEKSWKLDIPEPWVSESDENIHTFHKPDGYGALQISEHRKTSGKISDEDLFDLIELEDEAINHLKEVNLGGYRGFLLKFSEGDTFWNYWWLLRDNLLLFITYNCDLVDKEKESDEINNILKTLR